MKGYLFALFVALVFLGILLLLSLFKKRFDIREISNTDFFVAAFFILIVGLFSGEIASFKAGGIEVVKAIDNAKNESIQFDISSIISANKEVLEEIRASPKGTLDDLPNVFSNGERALELSFGFKGYDDRVIEKYLDKMNDLRKINDQSYYVVFLESGSRFLGVIDAHQLKRNLKLNENLPFSSLARVLGENDTASVIDLPGMMTKSTAVTMETARMFVLEKMEDNKLERLPVVDKEEFIGFAERDKLSASLVVAIATNIEK